MMNIVAMQGSAVRASWLLKAMANPHRLLILCLLVDGERSVRDLEGAIGLSQSALSQHLARLRRHDLVRARREAQTVYYSLAAWEVRAVIATLHDVFCGASASDDRGVPTPAGDQAHLPPVVA